MFGLSQGFAESISDTVLNERAPDEFLGSVMSLRTSVLGLRTTIGSVLSLGAAMMFGYWRSLSGSDTGASIIGVT